MNLVRLYSSDLLDVSFFLDQYNLKFQFQRLFPFDTQVCKITLESCKLVDSLIAIDISINTIINSIADGYSINKVRYQWSSGEYQGLIRENFGLPDYEILASAMRARNVSYATGMPCCSCKNVRIQNLQEPSPGTKILFAQSEHLMERETEGYFFLFFFNFFLPHTVAASRFSIKRLSMRQNVVVSRGATAIQALYLSSELPSGIYTRLSACFSFSRSSGFFIGQILFPAAAIVVVSWISLWMDQEIGIQVSTLNLLKSSRARGVIFRFPT